MEDPGMTERRMPTTLPSPADRGAFRFVAVDAAGETWRWVDEKLVWVRERSERGRDDIDADIVLH